MFSWNFREMWGAIGWLKNDLEQAEASAQATWSEEHHVDGTHGDVTASSVKTGSLSCGADVFRYDVAATTNTSSDQPGIVLQIPRKVSAIHLQGPIPSGGPYWFGIHSIDMPDTVPGDLLFVAINGPRLISSAFAYQPGGAFGPFYTAGNRIVLDPASTGSVSSDTVNFFEALDASVPGVTLLRVDRYDYDDINKGLRFPCWVQVG